jgi:hypothetical protein
MNRTISALRTLTLVATALLATAGAAQAQQTFDHNKALAGGISPGDTPGYPITLSRPGHYKLMGNLSVPAGVNGIAITASGVHLDLNGFSVSGPGSCTRVDTATLTCQGHSGGTGVYVNSVGVTLQNGTVRGFGNGVIGDGADSLHRMRVTQNLTGIVASSGGWTGVRIVDSDIDLNAGTGINISRGLIQTSRVVGNGGHGIVSNNKWQTVVHDSLVLFNKGTGLSTVTARGTVSDYNGTDQYNVRSLGGNASGATIY